MNKATQKFVIALLLLSSAPSLAQDTSKPRVAIIKEGAIAPFDGVLYDNRAFAEERAKSLLLNDKAASELRLALGLQGAKLKYATATTAAAYDSLSLSSAERLKIKDKYIEMLEDKLNTQNIWWENVLWYALGAGSILGGAYALSKIN